MTAARLETRLRWDRDQRENEFLESYERRDQPLESDGAVEGSHIGNPASRPPSAYRSDSDAGMELNEVGHRIFGQHWRLILFCVLSVLIGIGIAALARGGGETYTASSRLVLDTEDPKTRAESTAIADTAKAIATSPAQVRAALNDVHVTNRDSVDVAKHHVSIRALGTSAVVQLSVSDRNRRVAAAVSNALAARVIRARLDVSSGQLQQVLRNLDSRIDELNSKIASADTRIDSLNIEVANAGTAARANALRARRDAATRSRDFMAQQRGVVESERVSLLSTDALRPKPAIISPATVPERADPSHWLSYLILGALLGLILGVAWASLIEVMRPTLVGSDVLARELDTPLLGTLPSEPDADTSAEELSAISARLRLAAEAAGLEAIALFPAVSDVDLARFAERLAAMPARAADQAGSSALTNGARGALQIRPFSVQHPSADVQGLVLVAPNRMKKDKLIDVTHLLRLTPVPLLGLVTYDARSSRARKQTLDAALTAARASLPQR